MKATGYFLLTLGFLGAALVSVLAPLEVAWNWFAAGMLVAVTGVGLVRMKSGHDTGSDEAVQSGMEDLRASLEKIVAGVQTLRAEVDTTNPYAIHGKIDASLPPHLAVFVNARKAIIRRHGLQHYADVMSAFATGERYLNRVWSASCDGYIDEAIAYLAKSEKEFTTARQLLLKIETATPSTASL